MTQTDILIRYDSNWYPNVLWLKLISGCFMTQTALRLYISRRITICRFLGAFAKIAENNNYILHVCQSAWSNSALTWQIFMKFDLRIFSKICRENSSFITRIFYEGYRSCRSSLCRLLKFPPFPPTSFLLSPNISLAIIISNNLTLCFSLNVKNRVLHP
jgi:hypothetical protein